ncbi:MAG: OmpA family protein [Thermodesulfobacteriota bacterium]
MINYKRLKYALLGAVLLTVALCSGVALAADCKALHDGIRKERVLLKKKALVEAALKVCSNDPAIIYQDGYILERFRKYKDALVRYRRAISLDAGYAKAYFSIGDIETLQNNYREAVVAYTEGLRLEPGNDRARGSLAKVAVLAKKRGGGAAGSGHAAPVVAPASVAPVSPVVAKKTVGSAKGAAAVAPITRLNVPFQQKSTALSQDARDVLSVVVGQAMTRKDMRGNSFEVGGHTDNRGDAKENYNVSKKRAINVKKYLTEGFGIDSSRLKLVYHGQKKAKVPNTSPANRAINRRVDFSKID